MMKFLWPSVARKKIEQLRQIFAETFPAREQSEIAIDSGGPHVIVASCEMTVTADAVGFILHYRARFRGPLVSGRPGDPPLPHLFQRTTPTHCVTFMRADP